MKPQFILLLMCLVLLSGAAIAQPWQWELYEGDFYNPTGFPMPGWRPCVGRATELMADFSGNGCDDYFNFKSSCSGALGFIIAFRDPDNPGRWITCEGTDDLSGGGTVTGTCAIDLDDEPGAELIVIGDFISCWKLTSAELCRWDRRDDLLADLFFPEDASDAVFGDYDGDGLLNGVFTVPFPNEYCYEQNSEGLWEPDTLLLNEPFGEWVFHGDFDNDDDLDIAFIALTLDGWGTVLYYKNDGGVLTEESVSISGLGVGGGDLDGDGEWEMLKVLREHSSYWISEIETDTSFFFTEVSCTRMLSINSPGHIIGNLRTLEGQVIGGIENIRNCPICPEGCPEPFRSRFRGDSAWEDLEAGFTECAHHCREICMADLDGDSLRDIFTEQTAREYWVPVWKIWPNIGSQTEDLFDADQTVTIGRFLSNPDTTFSSPQMGDVDGDGRAELAVLTVFPGGGSHILVHEMIGPIEDTTFVHRPDLSLSLPYDIELFRMADIDSDGHAEIIFRRGNGEWQTWFWRGGWRHYENILPAFEADDVSFADFDNDGDLDLFTGEEVWISLNPSPMEEDRRELPQSYSLSVYPNPFNARATIAFSLPTDETAKLQIYDITGRLMETLLDRRLSAGEHTVSFNGAAHASGVYFLRLSAARLQTTTKMLLLK